MKWGHWRHAELEPASPTSASQHAVFEACSTNCCTTDVPQFFSLPEWFLPKNSTKLITQDIWPCIVPVSIGPEELVGTRTKIIKEKNKIVSTDNGRKSQCIQMDTEVLNFSHALTTKTTLLWYALCCIASVHYTALQKLCTLMGG